MKFSHSIQLNSVPEWSEAYIDYGRLKEYILQVERLLFNAIQKSPTDNKDDATDTNDNFNDEESKRRRAYSANPENLETDRGTRLGTWGSGDLGKRWTRSSSYGNDSKELENIGSPPSTSATSPSKSYLALVKTAQAQFSSSLDRELEKILAFHSDRLREYELEMDAICKCAFGEISTNNDNNDDMDLIDDPSASLLKTTRASRHVPIAGVKADDETLKSRISSLYINLLNLRDYLEINYSGFSKILKKFEKLTNGKIRTAYMRKVDAEIGGLQESAFIPRSLQNLEKWYADVFCGGDGNHAVLELKQKQKDHIIYERSTVWRDMVEMERKAQPSSIVVTAADAIALEEKKQAVWKRYVPVILLFLVATLFGIMVSVPIISGNTAQNNCLAIFVAASLLWSTEAIPLFVTSLLVPLLVIVFQVEGEFKALGGSDDPKKALAKHVFATMFSPTIMLLLGGFSIAAALSKYNIAKSMAISVLARTGKSPSTVLLSIMGIATFSSMWISNVAAPVLCFSIIQPILRNLPSDHSYAKCLILGIALASNIGGMTTPIASPQNAIAVGEMESKSWVSWLLVSLPLCVMCDVLVWLYLLLVYKPSRTLREVLPIRKSTESLSPSQIIVLAVSSITIVLWCLNAVVEKVFGDMGTIALIPMIVFFAMGLLTKEDLNNFPWTVVFLAMGGSVLGDAVKSSGLLRLVALWIKDGVQGVSLYVILVSFCGIILVITTFISHTVGAMVIVPVVKEIGLSLSPTPHPDLLIMGAALMCSGAMGLPVSGFPNMAAMSVENPVTGKPFLAIRDFLVAGVPSSFIAFICIITAGYLLMSLLSIQ